MEKIKIKRVYKRKPKKSLLEKVEIQKEEEKNVELIKVLASQNYSRAEISKLTKLTLNRIHYLMEKYKQSWKELRKYAPKIRPKERAKTKTFNISIETAEKLKEILPEIKTKSKKIQHLIDNSVSFENLDLDFFMKKFKTRNQKQLCIIWTNDYTQKLKALHKKEKVELDFIIWFLIDSYYQR